MKEKELNERLCKYIEQEAQLLNSLCPMISMIKGMTEECEHYDKNTIVAQRTGETLDGYLKRLYFKVQDLEKMHSEIQKISTLR